MNKMLVSFLIKRIRYIGAGFISSISRLWLFMEFIFITLSRVFVKPYFCHLIYNQIMVMGFFSLLIVGMTTFFSGAVLVLQIYNYFYDYSKESIIANILVLSIVKELGPVLSALMVAGRVGSSIAAELATMRVTEQIDAIFVLATDPIKYLIVPRVLSILITIPCIVFIGNITGILGGYILGIYKLNFNNRLFLGYIINAIVVQDIVIGLIKAIIFGFLISFISCYNGYYSERGAKGVGRAATKSVAGSSILILVSNYLLTIFMY